jgi:hypothetical protein
MQPNLKDSNGSQSDETETQTTKYFRLFDEDIPIETVKDMIISNKDRVKDAGENLTEEAIGVTLGVDALRNFTNKGAIELVALFAVDDYNGQTYATIILIGRDDQGRFIRDNGKILATERWQKYQPHGVESSQKVDDDPRCLDLLFGY